MFCNSCKAVVTWEQVEEEGVSDETRAFVREHWNTRAERTCNFSDHVADVAWCSECKEPREYPNYPNYCPNCGSKVIEDA